MSIYHISQEQGLSVNTVLGGVWYPPAIPQEGDSIRAGDSDASESGSWGYIASIIDWANEYRHCSLKAAKPEAARCGRAIPSSGSLSSGNKPEAPPTSHIWLHLCL